MYCKNCGALLREEVAFCESCGEAVASGGQASPVEQAPVPAAEKSSGSGKSLIAVIAVIAAGGGWYWTSVRDKEPETPAAGAVVTTQPPAETPSTMFPPATATPAGTVVPPPSTGTTATQARPVAPKNQLARADGSHLRDRAKSRYLCDLDGNGRIEEVLVVSAGAKEEGRFFSLAVLDENGGLIWSGPSELNPDNPMVFGEWDFGISWPQVIGDIDGDSVVELVANAPISDVSPMPFRVLRWENKAFKLARKAVLLEDPPGSGRFPWSNSEEPNGSWVSKFQAIESNGDISVEVTHYKGGADAGTSRVLLRADASGFTAKSSSSAAAGSSAVPPPAVKAYRARLGIADHSNSRGEALEDVISILRQDRANFHRLQRSDADDERDPFFAEASDREIMEQMSIECADANWEQRILNGTPLVEVTVGSGILTLRIIRD